MFGPLKIFVPKKRFWSEKKKCLLEKQFDPKKILVPKKCLAQKMISQKFHIRIQMVRCLCGGLYPKICTLQGLWSCQPKPSVSKVSPCQPNFAQPLRSSKNGTSSREEYGGQEYRYFFREQGATTLTPKGPFLKGAFIDPK